MTFGANKKYYHYTIRVLLVLSVILLFAGALVTGTGSGLAVPDWPLAYGMLFPPMVGGILYEHGHRIIASLVGFVTCLEVLFAYTTNRRKHIKYLSLASLFLVVAQGLLGGITVIYCLPVAISALHALTAQIFFALVVSTVILESYTGAKYQLHPEQKKCIKWVVTVIVILFIQILLGALMRHTGAGLAIPDFPTFGGEILPNFSERMIENINQWSFEHGLEQYNRVQMVLHIIHRILGVIIAFLLPLMILVIRSWYPNDKVLNKIQNRIYGIIFIQFWLGIYSIVSELSPVVVGLHLIGAAILIAHLIWWVLRVAYSDSSFGERKKGNE